jgi:NitT/TauT family transport system ATP-binding protein
MKMRVSLARALVTEPELLLLDEPFAALDELIRFRLAENLRSLWRERSRPQTAAAKAGAVGRGDASAGQKRKKPLTVVFVTHSLSEAVYLADRVLVLSPRPAKLVADLRIELPEERTMELRTDPRYSRELRRVFDAFTSSAFRVEREESGRPEGELQGSGQPGGTPAGEGAP